MATLATVDLVKNYGRAPAVRGVCLTVDDGELLCILGPSGCGKSTTLRVIGGFEQADGGDVRLDGVSIAALPPNRRPTAMVFQKYTLWPHMRVFDNVAFGLRLRHLDKATITGKVGEALELVGLPEVGRRYPHQLSGGEQQRIALARALVLEPRVLLLDEPLSNLDARLRVRMREEIKRIQRRVSITTVFVTHDQEEALSVADRIAVMNEGRLEQVDTPTAVYNRPRTLFVADFIGRMNRLAATYPGDHGALRTDIGLLPAPEGVSWPLGTELVVAIRPEDLRLARPGDGLAFRARVEVVMELGHYRQVSLQAISGPVPGPALIMIVGKDVDVRAGESIAVTPTRYLAYARPAGVTDEDHDRRAEDAPAPLEVALDATPRVAV